MDTERASVREFIRKSPQTYYRHDTGDGQRPQTIVKETVRDASVLDGHTPILRTLVLNGHKQREKEGGENSATLAPPPLQAPGCKAPCAPCLGSALYVKM